MTRKEISQLRAGQGIDSLIQIHLFNDPPPATLLGNYREGCSYGAWTTAHVGAGVLEWWAPPYSTDCAWAWKAAGRSEGKVTVTTSNGESFSARAYNIFNERVNPSVVDATAAMAICKAVLMTCFL